MVEDPGTSRNNMHENRETSRASAENADRSAKAQSRKADMYAMEESDCRVVPVKQPNKGGQPFAEAVEERKQEGSPLCSINVSNSAFVRGAAKSLIGFLCWRFRTRLVLRGIDEDSG